MQSLAEWRLGRVTSETKKNKQRVNLEPPRPMAARLINLEPPRPMAARLTSFDYNCVICHYSPKYDSLPTYTTKKNKKIFQIL